MVMATVHNHCVIELGNRTRIYLASKDAGRDDTGVAPWKKENKSVHLLVIASARQLFWGAGDEGS